MDPDGDWLDDEDGAYRDVDGSIRPFFQAGSAGDVNSNSDDARFLERVTGCVIGV